MMHFDKECTFIRVWSSESFQRDWRPCRLVLPRCYDSCWLLMLWKTTKVPLPPQPHDLSLCDAPLASAGTLAKLKTVVRSAFDASPLVALDVSAQLPDWIKKQHSGIYSQLATRTASMEMLLLNVIEKGLGAAPDRALLERQLEPSALL